MHTIAKLTILIGVAVALAALVSTDAKAQANRTFVSGQGSDTNLCSLSEPCRSFARAVTQTNPGGEITVLDSAGYGTVIITQSITITSPDGVEASITATSGQTGIIIDTTAGANVTLRGLTLEGGGVGVNGINLNSTLPLNSGISSLNIIGCVVKDFTGDGIIVQPTDAGGSGLVPTVNVVIADSFSLNNGSTGIALLPPGSNVPFVIAAIYRTIASGNATGVNIVASGGPLNALFANSHADNNASTGISVSGFAQVKMKASTANYTASGQSGTDIANSASLKLYNGNTVGTLNNSGNAFTDGSNNFDFVNGNALIKLNPQ